MIFHERVEGSRMRTAQADVFVENEHGHPREIQRVEFGVHALHGGTGGKTEHRVGLLCHEAGNDARRGQRNVLRRGDNNHFHATRRASTSLANRSTNCMVQRVISSVGSLTSGVRSMAYSTAVARSMAFESRNVAFARFRPAAARS